MNNLFSAKRDSIKNLKDAQDALTLDPNSVMAEDNIIKFGKKYDSEINKLKAIQNKLSTFNAKIDAHTKETGDAIQTYQSVLSNNEKLFKQYNENIKQKRDLIATRDRMLQLSQERNIYKKKMIYVLLSIIIALVVMVIAIYSIFSK